MSWTSPPLLLLAGSTVTDIQEQLACDDESILRRSSRQPAAADGPFRLAIVGADKQRLNVARRVVAAGASWRGRKDVWFSGDDLIGRGGSIALLFPGLEQKFNPMLDEVADQFGLTRLDIDEREYSVLNHSISLLHVGRFLDSVVRRMGIEPAAIAGHSIGEWNAMVSAGMIPSSSLDAFLSSLDPAVFELPDCVFAALGCGADIAEDAIRGIANVVVTHDNCPHQSIICGQEDAVIAAVSRLNGKGVAARLLHFRSGFHSPFLAPYIERVAGIAKTPLHLPLVPTWSATTSRPFPEDEIATRELMIRHLLEPVRFRTLIENMHHDGIRAFVQVGVGSLTSFVEDTLAGRDFVTVATTIPGQPGTQQLCRVAAALWAEGAALRLDELTADRKPLAMEQLSIPA
ncbi:acyltransferase domain-containing protein [Silvibacterium sp.]|uniref:acyltransferase domain-containing protein n=1 Tax=Silvibacterium sp. TaxID=1964179 RepID=UPI0039E35A39